MNALAALAALAPQLAQTPWRQYATPEVAGFSSERLAEARELADRSRSAAILAVVDGNVLVAWGEVERRLECHSVRKSLMNALLGMAVAKGELSLDATLAELGIDDLAPLTADEKRATVRDLVSARSGVYHSAAKEPADMRAERPARGSHAHGEHFFYNNWDFNVLGTIFERATGERVGAAFQAWLATPLGMQDFRPEDVFEELEPSYSRFPAHAFRISARDLARVGELYRLGGTWSGRTLLSPEWIAETTTPHTAFETGRGYGYLWWTYGAGSLGSSYPTLDAHDCFAAQGTGGQFLLVVPTAGFVFVHRGDTENERDVRGSVAWALAERILAAREAPAEDEPELVDLHVERLSDPGPPRPDHRAVAVAPERLTELVGEYAMQVPDMRVRVFLHEGRLFVHRSDGDEAELLPLSDSRFFLWVNSYLVEFERDAAGTAQSVRLITPRGTLVGSRAGN